ncbi:hypothetical protein J6590_013128 [Homalodisca vitripennis]|nr:hypothetical protein J6590_013128 [Homalodisca vitripennis]
MSSRRRRRLKRWYLGWIFSITDLREGWGNKSKYRVPRQTAGFVCGNCANEMTSRMLFKEGPFLGRLKTITDLSAFECGFRNVAFDREHRLPNALSQMSAMYDDSSSEELKLRNDDGQARSVYVEVKSLACAPQRRLQQLFHWRVLFAGTRPADCYATDQVKRAADSSSLPLHTCFRADAARGVPRRFETAQTRFPLHHPRINLPRTHRPRIKHFGSAALGYTTREMNRPRIYRSQINHPRISRPRINYFGSAALRYTASQINRPRVYRSQINHPRISRPRINYFGSAALRYTASQINRPRVYRSQINRPRINHPRINTTPQNPTTTPTPSDQPPRYPSDQLLRISRSQIYRQSNQPSSSLPFSDQPPSDKPPSDQPLRIRHSQIYRQSNQPSSSLPFSDQPPSNKPPSDQLLRISRSQIYRQSNQPSSSLPFSD